MTRRLLLAVAASFALLRAPAASAQQATLGLTDEESAANVAYLTGQRLTFFCPATDPVSPQIWGTDVYAAESAICPAAIHAGVLTRGRAGLVSITIGGAADSFQGSVRNGVTSASYDAWPYSYTFNRDIAPGRVGWATTAQHVRSDFQQPITVVCPTGGDADELIYGTDTYIDESSICVAAVHAGVIGFDGGAVAVTMLPGLDRYEATERHGVSSRSWSAWPVAFRVAAAAAGSDDAVASAGRTIRLAGFTASGTATPILPRTIMLAGFTAAGTSPPIVPRTIRLRGWTASGSRSSP